MTATEFDEQSLEELLYPGCLWRNWQMNHSERMTLAALLGEVRPDCAIEVGTYCGGSLSLLARYARQVISIDIDPTVAQRFDNLENVTFRTGSSSAVLPALLSELDRRGQPVDFILIDGDHSREGVRTDIESVLRYQPRKVLFMLCHDSFNPECRQGMLDADWTGSRYVHWVDLDFVPGRLIEHGGGGDGECWGGLALAIFRPDPRKEELVVQQTARRMHEYVAGIAAPERHRHRGGVSGALGRLLAGPRKLLTRQP